MNILALLLPIIIFGTGIYILAWIIDSLNTLVQENRKIRKLLEYKFSLNEEEKISLYEDINTNTWRSILKSKLTLLLIAVIVIISVRLLLKTYHIY